MTVTTGNAEDESQLRQGGDLATGGAGATESLIGVPVSGDRCAVCGAELAADQRYCVECGTRRGAPRFAANLRSARAGTSVAAPAKRDRRPASATLLAAIATILIAVGVGVLIGHDTSSKAPTVKLELTSAGTGSASGSTGGSTSKGSGTGSSNGASTGSGSHGSGSNSSGSSAHSSGNFFGG